MADNIQEIGKIMLWKAMDNLLGLMEKSNF